MAASTGGQSVGLASTYGQMSVSRPWLPPLAARRQSDACLFLWRRPDIRWTPVSFSGGGQTLGGRLSLSLAAERRQSDACLRLQRRKKTSGWTPVCVSGGSQTSDWTPVAALLSGGGQIQVDAACLCLRRRPERWVGLE